MAKKAVVSLFVRAVVLYIHGGKVSVMLAENGTLSLKKKSEVKDFPIFRANAKEK